MAAMAMCKKTQQKAQQKHELWPCSAWDTEDEPMEKRVCFFVVFFGKVPEVRDDGSMNCGICFFLWLYSMGQILQYRRNVKIVY